MFNIEEELKKLPGKPGVYIMHDDKDAIIYVGKAISLKNRVRQYFQSSRNKTIKIEQMVSKIKRFEYIVTDSEVEALVLECNLIKEHRPKYNTMLTDDKTYPFIRVTVNEAYPRVMLSRTMKKDKSKYFGPYTSAGAVKDTISLLQKIYKIRTCNRNLPRDIKKARPCLNYHIKQCDAPCQGYISEEEYGKNITQVLDFLNGNLGDVEKMLEGKMMDASENMEFEKAIEYRELLNAVKQISQKQKITNNDLEDKDVIALSRDGNDGVIQVFFIRNGRLIGREHFHMDISIHDSKGEIVSSFIKQFYSGTPYIPKELMIQEEIEDMELIEQWLTKKRGLRVYIRVPKKGSKEKLVELAEKNAAMVLVKDKERIKIEEMKTIGAMKEIEELLGISNILRVEAFDISNISGYQSVGSMIVYENGRPKRSDYRKFKIKSVAGPDDYASMYEVLTRRFTHGIQELNNKDVDYGSFTKFPDLIMMDGGRGQVNIAQKVLDELKLSIPVCGMVKDDNHRTRGLYYQNKEIPIERNSEGFRLITRVQDEAHRFAIEYHRSLRSKGQVHSILDDIDGIGPARRKALMQHFTSLDEIKNAQIDTLKNIPTMNEASARKVYEFFHIPRNV
ncbi:excinuclease ABC subunit UvrC [Candidatus Galacturonibacter soehngenii]|uniref:UvrABC system protein C n=1 Tax=Candidatus Galacturonatibacter soehngenii TaxID=2307010 RepID=A0A7V7UBV6_9FIRM|nr:excinuclease ABC subunit UvrC [Candidatus Galacturonibacter soehngenii]KAB1438305.1 excinuclease ABC subunit UvrC [Candidatus Galacturonibacter soehngenii]MBA4686479.1 excinuclease ABC subunit UvrC [Candidatus Galacturonibacter soehngenii]